MLTTLTIDNNEYQSYLTVEEADIALAVEVNRRAAWNALTADEKARNLVASTRRIDFFEFKGVRAGPNQDTKWPRRNDGDAEDLPTDAVSSGNTIPDPIEEATALLAGTIAQNPAAAGVQHPDSNRRGLKRVKAGTADVEFFNSQATSAGATNAVVANSLVAQELADAEAQLLLRPYILMPETRTTGETAAGAFSFGTDRQSQSESSQNEFDRAYPFA